MEIFCHTWCHGKFKTSDPIGEILETKIPSEMEVAPRYTLLTESERDGRDGMGPIIPLNLL